MSVTFSVSGIVLRTFLSTIQCASKLGDGVFFVAHQTYLEISALSSTSSCHLLAVVQADTLGGYRYTELATGGSEDDNPVFFYLLTRTLQATVLHQPISSLASITISFSLAPQEGDQLTDSVKWECACVGGVLKTFHLHTATAVPKRVCTDGVDFPFTVRGNPETFGYLLACLPGSAGECIFFPLPSRVELRCGQVSAKENERFDHTSTRVSTAVVTANPSSFDSFECNVDPQAEHGTTTLPGKMVELRPVKVACMLCKYLSLPMQLDSGYERSPLVIRSVGYQAEDNNGSHLRGGGASEAYVPISFVMHIAGLDVAYSDGAEDGNRRDTTTAVPPRHATSGRPSEKRGERVRLPSNLTGASMMVAATPSAGSVVPATLSGPPSNAAASQHDVDTSGSAADDSADAFSSWPQPSAGVPARVASQVTHVDASYVSGSTNGSATGENSAPRRSRPVLTPKDVVASGSKTPSESHRPTGGSVVADSQVNSGRQSMTALYPLDFEAFTKGSVDDDKEEIDEELQRFLDSCTAMLMGEADQHDKAPS